MDLIITIFSDNDPQGPKPGASMSLSGAADEAGEKVESVTSAAKQFAEKPTMLTSGAEALVEEEGFIAALKALRHPKANFSANC